MVNECINSVFGVYIYYNRVKKEYCHAKKVLEEIKALKEKRINPKYLDKKLYNDKKIIDCLRKEKQLFSVEKGKVKLIMNTYKDKVIGTLIGGAVGDALGYQIEFKRGIKEKQVNKYFEDKGIISDDTQMTLFTANALIWRETRLCRRGMAMSPTDAIYEAYLDWLDTQNNTNLHRNQISWIKDIKELNVTRAPGNTCISALSKGTKGTIKNPINDSKGCGGIMRIAPIGIYIDTALNAGEIAAETNALTHGHPLGIMSSYILAVMLHYIVKENLSIEISLNKAIKLCKKRFRFSYFKDKNYLFKLLNKAVKLSKQNVSDLEAITSLGEGWVAEETLAIAVYSCLKYSNSLEDAVVCAVNHDGDSDSTGAVAGNIIGASLGYSAIPKYYVDNLELKDVIVELATDLTSKIPLDEYKPDSNLDWVNKYVECHKDR